MSIKRSTLSVLACAAILAAAGVSAFAQAPAVDLAKLDAMAARRFPQPVLVSDLAGIPVFDGTLGRLGTTEKVVRLPNGTANIVIRYGGLFGFGGRSLALPLSGIAMLGRQVVVMDIAKDQLDAWPTWTPSGAQPLPPGDTVKVGLTKN